MAMSLELFCSFVVPPKEANEVTADVEGRWFVFSLDLNSLVLMEKKSCPSHLQGLPCIDQPVPLSTVIRELEDAGEALTLTCLQMVAFHNSL